jgi:Chaperone of endosialidase
MKKSYTKPALVRIAVLSKTVAEAGVSPLKGIISDRQLKTNIARIGTTVLGLPLYRFSYLGSDKRFTGVMAQDVLAVLPDAVRRDASGFYRVNYGMLGIAMQEAT